LGHRAAAVVGYDVNRLPTQRVEKFREHRHLSTGSQVCLRGHFGVTHAHQIERDAAANVGQSGQLAMPNMFVHHDAMNK